MLFTIQTTPATAKTARPVATAQSSRGRRRRISTGAIQPLVRRWQRSLPHKLVAAARERNNVAMILRAIAQNLAQC